jgi:hypothetical protein
MRRFVMGALASAFVASSAAAETFWIEYDPAKNDTKLPEEVGWQRSTYGGGALRWFENGALVIDGLGSSQIADDYWVSIALDPVPGEEIFVIEWRLRVDGAYCEDPLMAIDSAGNGLIMLCYHESQFYSVAEGVWTGFEGGCFHDYRIESLDMQAFSLFIDAEYVREGSFEDPGPFSGVTWGDGSIGCASRSTWRWVRFGILPLPQLGDVNCDGTVDFRDINPFVQALADAAGYMGSYPGCWSGSADINDDGSADFGDISPFVELLVQ